MSQSSLSSAVLAVQLAELLKQTHKSLRESFQESENGIETVWTRHVENKEHLQKYAEAMHTLATQHWDTKDNVSRIKWIHDAITTYFYKGDIQLRTEKEKRKVSALRSNDLEKNHDMSSTMEWYNDSRPLNTLDVGSCYNPFRQFEDLHVTPIDLHPAKPDVFKCDFLSVEILSRESDEEKPLYSNCLRTELEDPEKRLEEGEKNAKKRPALDGDMKHGKKMKSNGLETSNAHNKITNLEICSFDVVIFSLFLEYIPCPKLRFECCCKAYKLLKPNGILCIVTPDSKHATANVHLFKLWKISLSNMGFNRVKYEKCAHFHGMVFRKGIAQSVWQDDSKRELTEMKAKKISKRFVGIDYDKILNSIYIVQDLKGLRCG